MRWVLTAVVCLSVKRIHMRRCRVSADKERQVGQQSRALGNGLRFGICSQQPFDSFLDELRARSNMYPWRKWRGTSSTLSEKRNTLVQRVADRSQTAFSVNACSPSFRLDGDLMTGFRPTSAGVLPEECQPSITWSHDTIAVKSVSGSGINPYQEGSSRRRGAFFDLTALSTCA